MAAITYTAQKHLTGPAFHCPRCEREHPFPQDGGQPVRCECGWWYWNTGKGKLSEAFRPRIGGAKP